VYGKWTFHAVGTEKSTQPVIAGAFDVAGGNAEYDVPACNRPVQQQGNHIEGCVHIASTTQSVSLAMKTSEEMLAECPKGYMELVHAHGHQHAAGLGMELYEDVGTAALLVVALLQQGRLHSGTPAMCLGATFLMPHRLSCAGTTTPAKPILE